MKLLFGLLICLVAAINCLDAAKSSTGSGTAADRAKLRKELFTDYDNMNLPDNANVSFGLALINFDVDVEKNIMEVFGWFRYVWNDDRLGWDDKKSPVGVLRVANYEVWKPDITLYNSANLENMVPCGQSNALVYPTGSVLWVPPCTYKAICDLTDLKENPKKTFQCELKFGSWTFDGLIMDTNFYNNDSSVDMTDFRDVSEWKIVSSSGERIVKYYDCCAEPYISLNYKFEIQRKSNVGKCAA